MLAVADVSVTKEDSPDPVNAGANLTYTITVTNDGPDAADSVQWTDTLPADTTFVSLASPAGWSCIPLAVGASGQVSCSIPTLSIGNAVFTLIVAVDPAVAADTVLSNDAVVSSTTSDPDTNDLTGNATTTVTTFADLAVTKVDVPDPVTAGTNLTYTITVTNGGPSNAASAELIDTLPADTTFVSLSSPAGWSCISPPVGGVGTVSCTNPSMGVGDAVFTLVVAVDPDVAAGTVLTNIASASSPTGPPDTDDLNGISTTTVAADADLSVAKVDTPDPVTAGTNLTYTINVTNSGPSNAATVAMSDPLPPGTTFVSLTWPAGWSCTTPPFGGTGTVDCSIASLGVTTATFTLTVAVDPALPAGSVITNIATAMSPTAPPDTDDLQGISTTTVVTATDLSVTKIDTPDPVTAGTNLTYTITVTNNGPSNAAAVDLSDTVPANTTFVSFSAPAGWTCTSPAVGATGPVDCSIATMAPGSAVFTFVVAVGPSVVNGTVITNTATVSSPSDANPLNDDGVAATTVVVSGDLSVVKVDTPDPVTAGTNLTYTITVTNNGPSNAAAVNLSDTVPANTRFVSISAPAGWTCTSPAVGATGPVDCSIANMAPGNAVFTLVVAVDPSVADGTVITNTATVSSTSDANPLNDVGVAATTVGFGSADLSITKTDSPDPVNAGANLTYTITVANAGPTNATTGSLSDPLPANTTFVSLASPGGWSCTTPPVGGTGTVTCTNPSVPIGTSVFTLVVAVNASTVPNTVITNTASISSATADPNTGNGSAPATTTVLSPASLTATKTVAGTFEAGSNITYTIVISNAGPSTQADNPGSEFTDVLPAQLDLVSATASSGTAVAAIATNTVNWNGSIAAGGSVTITIVATIDPGVPIGTTISNQGAVSYDADGNGTNEPTPRPTDDPSEPGPADPTSFVVAAPASLATIPMLDPRALMALAVLLAVTAAVVLKR